MPWTVNGLSLACTDIGLGLQRVRAEQVPRISSGSGLYLGQRLFFFDTTTSVDTPRKGRLDNHNGDGADVSTVTVVTSGSCSDYHPQHYDHHHLR